MSQEEHTSTNLVDVAVLLGTASLLVAIHFGVNKNIRSHLLLDHADPVLLTFWTASYIHFSLTHLLRNIIGFLFVSLITLQLATAAQQKYWFRVQTVINIALLPVAVNYSDYLLWSYQLPSFAPVSGGFSSVTAAFVGTLLVSLHGYLRQWHQTEVANILTALLFGLTFVFVGRRSGNAGQLASYIGSLIFLVVIISLARTGTVKQFR